MNSTSLHGIRTNPVWAALTTGNKTLAEGHGLALRYPPEICAFAGMKSPTPEAYEQLLALVPGSGRISLLTADNSEPPTPFFGATLDIRLPNGGGRPGPARSA
jgi:hypothetical protein